MYRVGVEGEPEGSAGGGGGLSRRGSFFASVYGRFAIKPSTIRNLGVFAAIVAVFALAYWLPFGRIAARGVLGTAGRESLLMLQEYARQHVLLCLVPAFFIAGAISVFVSQAAVLRYFGAQANKLLAYSVASVSGTILAVCSCTILPLFAGIYNRGAGIGPAIAFLYSGPAINVLAIILTARVLGWRLGVARAVGAVALSVVIGLLMHGIYRREDRARVGAGGFVLPEDEPAHPLWMQGIYVGVMIGILVFANWARPAESSGLWHGIWLLKWPVTGVLLGGLALMVWRWFAAAELRAWVASTWGYAKQILPLLFLGVLAAGLLLGRPGRPALVPERWVVWAVGGNSLGANLFASVAGALMYFATLTEVPILQGLLGAGMGNGPGLALLLAGPALSLPSMLVIRSVIGTRKMLVYVGLVVALSTAAGWSYGAATG